MRSTRRTSPFLAGNRLVVLLTALMLAAGLTATTAIAGGEATVAKKKKKKRCPAGTHKVVIKKKKNGRIIKKRKCVPNATTTPTPPTAPTPTPAPGQTLIPNTNSFTWEGNTQHHAGLPCPACPTASFTFTNTASTGTGTLASSIQNILDPIAGDDEAFFITGDTCAGTALAAGASCSVTITFSPPSNAGDGNYSAILHVIGSPGGDAQIGLAGHAT
jgi:hypothetical protein